MDAIDILGSLLGHKSSRPGRGTDVLQDILRGGSRAETRSPAAPAGPAPPRSKDLQRDASELEDLLNVAHNRSTPGRTGPSTSPEPPRRDVGLKRDRSAPEHRDSQSQPPETRVGVSQDERALVLVRAMINAAKSDGEISQSEQQSILERLGDTSRETIEFLRSEFSKPLDVHEFARSVPIGMEQQVYTMSLIAIDLDTSREAKYLLELSQSLRIPSDVREQIHQRLGAPCIY